MAIKTGILRAAGLAKESVLGTLVATPDIYIPFKPSLSFFPDISLLEEAGIRAQADKVIQADQGPIQLKSGKVDWNFGPEDIGEHLMAGFGTDTISETASFIITTGVNDKIDFKENGGSQLHATIAGGTYAMGTSSAVNGSLCKAIKTAMEAAVGATLTYTVTYSYTTKKVTITASSTTVQILWLTGTNQATAAYAVLGFSHTDTSAAIAVTSDSTTAAFVMAHAFTRVASELLPSYSWWVDAGNKYMQFPGCMLNKLEFTVKAKEYVSASAEWHGLSYDDTGTSKSPTYSSRRRFIFQDAVLKLDGAQVLNYDNLKISIENDIEVDHVLGNSKMAGLIFSKGFMVLITADFYFTDAAQFNKFIAGTTASLDLKLSSSENISGAIPYSLDMSVPVIQYRTAPLPVPAGPIKVSFAAVAKYDTNSLATATFTLSNTRATAY